MTVFVDQESSLSGAGAAVPRSIVVAYSIGSLGTGIYLTVPSVLLLFYLTEVLDVTPALAGMAVLLPRIFDVLTDPLMGWVSDRTKTRIGRRRPYLLVGSVLTGISLIFLFSAPQSATGEAGFVYVLTVYILSAAAYTVFAVPYLSMPAEMSESTDQRTKIMAWRMTFAMAGVLAGSALAPILLEAFGGGRPGFAGMSLVLGLICMLAMLVAYMGTARAPVVPLPIPSGHVFSNLLEAARNKSFNRLASAYVLQLGGLGIFTACVPYFVKYVVGRSESAIAILFAALLSGTMLSMLGWAFLAQRAGKRRCYLLGAVLTSAGLFGVFLFSGAPSWNASILLTVVIGCGFGGLQLIPFAILTDIIQMARRSGRDMAGTMTGLWTALEKAALAVGPAALGIILMLSGFASGVGVQSSTAELGIRVGLGIMPAILVLISIPVGIARLTDLDRPYPAAGNCKSGLSD